MPSKRHKKASELFHAACKMDPDARAAFLKEACAGDTKLRAEVAALLAQDEQHPSFPETPKTLEAPSNPGLTTRTGKPPPVQPSAAPRFLNRSYSHATEWFGYGFPAGQQIGQRDTLIGPIARYHGEPIVTRNKKHFGRIPRLVVQEY